MQINLLVVCDRNYLKHAITALTSACVHNSGNVLRIYLIHTGLDQADMESARIHLKRYNATISFLQPQQNFGADLHVHRHISSATYLRLLCGALLPQEIDRILYLDCDVIVVSALEELFATDLGNCTIAAVRDAYIGTHKLPTHLDMLPTAQIDYFNSGVMLIDLARYRMTRTGIQRSNWPNAIRGNLPTSTRMP
jgi:lipopolysaccharide biosynthesis glycosyltransferase